MDAFSLQSFLFFLKKLLTLLTFCDIVKNALLWQDMPSSLSKNEE